MNLRNEEASLSSSRMTGLVAADAHLAPRAAKGAGHDARAAVVAVQAALRDDDADLLGAHPRAARRRRSAAIATSAGAVGSQRPKGEASERSAQPPPPPPLES